jgi:hypothetical protein
LRNLGSLLTVFEFVCIQLLLVTLKIINLAKSQNFVVQLQKKKSKFFKNFQNFPNFFFFLNLDKSKKCYYTSTNCLIIILLQKVFPSLVNAAFFKFLHQIIIKKMSVNFSKYSKKIISSGASCLTKS